MEKEREPQEIIDIYISEKKTNRFLYYGNNLVEMLPEKGSARWENSKDIYEHIMEIAQVFLMINNSLQAGEEITIQKHIRDVQGRQLERVKFSSHISASEKKEIDAEWFTFKSLMKILYEEESTTGEKVKRIEPKIFERFLASGKEIVLKPSSPQEENSPENNAV